MTKVAVVPLGCLVSRNSLSKRNTRSVTASSVFGMPFAESSSWKRLAIKSEHWPPPWPSNTPKKPHVSLA